MFITLFNYVKSMYLTTSIACAILSMMNVIDRRHCVNCGVPEKLEMSFVNPNEILSNLVEWPQGILCRDCQSTILE